MAKFDGKSWPSLMENHGQVLRKIMAKFDGKSWQTLIENHGQV
jgi:hypothetical protein